MFFFFFIDCMLKWLTRWRLRPATIEPPPPPQRRHTQRKKRRVTHRLWSKCLRVSNASSNDLVPGNDDGYRCTTAVVTIDSPPPPPPPPPRPASPPPPAPRRHTSITKKKKQAGGASIVEQILDESDAVGLMQLQCENAKDDASAMIFPTTDTLSMQQQVSRARARAQCDFVVHIDCCIIHNHFFFSYLYLSTSRCVCKYVSFMCV